MADRWWEGPGHVRQPQEADRLQPQSCCSCCSMWARGAKEKQPGSPGAGRPESGSLDLTGEEAGERQVQREGKAESGVGGRAKAGLHGESCLQIAWAASQGGGIRTEPR